MKSCMFTVLTCCVFKSSYSCWKKQPTIRCSTFVRPQAELNQYRYQHDVYLQSVFGEPGVPVLEPTLNTTTSVLNPPKDTLFDDVKCGTMDIDPSHWIMVGQDAPVKAWPWQAYVESEKYRCGGVLIAHHWVLTAAHCVSNNKFVSFGVNDLKKRTSDSRRIAVRAEFVPHKWTSLQVDDIGLIQLVNPVPFNDFISPACLPRDREDLRISDYCYATGFGVSHTTTSRLQQLKMRVLPQRTCRYAWKITGNPFINDEHVCVDALDVDRRASMCIGDSGGPLSCLVRGKYFVIGVASFIYRGCNGTIIPNVYTRVSSYIDWIRKIIRDN